MGKMTTAFGNAQGGKRNDDKHRAFFLLIYFRIDKQNKGVYNQIQELVIMCNDYLNNTWK